MRDIEFRGKNDDEEWIYGAYSKSNSSWDIEDPFRVAHSIITSKTVEFIEPDTLGQYIERLDKFENKIYDGDIVELKIETIFPLNDYATECTAYQYCYGVVEWVAPEFRIKGLRGSEFYDPMGDLFSWEELRVVGNRWENPELLEDK